MKRCLLGVLAVGYMTASFAFNPLQKLGIGSGEISSNKSPKPTTRAATALPYTDFSGSWSGKCENSGEVLNLKIKNDANELEINNESISIGEGLQTNFNSDNRGNFLEHNIAVWNADKSEIIMHSVVVTRPYTNETLETEIFKGSVALQNNKLMLKVDTMGIVGVETQGKESFVCTLDRKD